MVLIQTVDFVVSFEIRSMSPLTLSFFAQIGYFGSPEFPHEFKDCFYKEVSWDFDRYYVESVNQFRDYCCLS